MTLRNMNYSILKQDSILFTQSKHTPMCIAGFDYTGNGVLEMVIGWSNGKMDIRNQETGEVLCKTMFGSHIAGIVTVTIY